MNPLLLVLAIAVQVLARTLPSTIRKCSKSDPNLNKCLDVSAVETARLLKDGNSDLGVVPLEPFVINRVDLGDTNSGAVSLHQVYDNMTIFGMTNAHIFDSNASFTGGNCFWSYKCRNPEIRVEANYTMKGQLLLFPINGHGQSTIYFYEADGDYGAKCERFKKKNKTYLRITEFSFDLRPKRVVFNFDNIIDGNEQLSREVVKTLNENAESVFSDVGPGFNKVMATVWKQTINNIFSRVPEDELFLP